jgi:T-complex protein 1 subunit theta
MKDGTRHFKGVEEAVQRNIEACKDLAATTRSCFGPKGMSKMVINHLEKLFVTNDAATIMSQLEVQHPAAKMIVLAAQMQEQEIGDGTNTVVMLAASLLEHASELLNMGLKPVEIVDGYERAMETVLATLEDSVVETLSDIRNEQQVYRAVRSAVMSKQYGNEDLIAKLVTTACMQIMPQNETGFNVDNIRVTKIMGASLAQSNVLNGMVFRRNAEGEIRQCKSAKIAVYTCPFDITQTETKGTVLLNTADELKKYSRGEEVEIEKQLDMIASTGVTVVVSGGKFGDLYLHHLNARGIMAVRLMSKFDLRRLCRSVGATPMTGIMQPQTENIGHCDEVVVEEMGDTEVVAFRHGQGRGRVATIVLRGGSNNMLDDIERAVDDAVNTVKAASKDGRLLAGGGAIEIELSRKVDAVASQCAGIEQYAIRQYGLALESLPKQITDNAGMKSTEVLAKIVAAHAAGNVNACISLDNEGDAGVGDAVKLGLVDLLSLKVSAIKLATNAATTVLLVDQIIMAKPAGGPKPKSGPRAMDGGEDE